MNRSKALEILTGFPPDVCASLWGHLALEGHAPLEPASNGPGDPFWAQHAALFAASVLALADDEVAKRLDLWRQRQSESVPEAPDQGKA